MNNNMDSQLTPKQQYDKIQQQIRQDNAIAKGEFEEDALDSAVEAIEDYLGNAEDDEPETGVTVTKEENDNRKAKELEAETISSIETLKDVFVTQHLPTEIKKKIDDLLWKYHRNELDDPVLIHLLKQKIQSVTDYLKTKEEVKELNKTLFEQLNTASSNLIKVKGVLEYVDKQIAEYIV